MIEFLKEGGVRVLIRDTLIHLIHLIQKLFFFRGSRDARARSENGVFVVDKKNDVSFVSNVSMYQRITTRVVFVLNKRMYHLYQMYQCINTFNGVFS